MSGGTPRVSARLLGRLQAQFNRDLTDLCTVLRPQEEKDAAGSQRTTLRPFLENVPCAVRAPRGQREGETGERVEAVADAEVELPAGTEVEATDELLVRKPGDATGTRYQVLGPDAPRTDPVLVVVRCVRADRVAQGVNL